MTAKQQGGRRRRGEGSYVQLKSRGGVWRFQLKGADGFTMYSNPGEELDDFQDRVAAHRLGRKKKFRSPGDYTLNDCIRDWLEDMAELVADEEVSPNTLRIYRTCAAAYEEHEAGQTTLAELIGRDVEEVLKSKRDVMTTQTLSYVKRTAVESVNMALSRGLADADTAASVAKARVPRGRSAGRPTKRMSLPQFLAAIEFSYGLWHEEGRPDPDAWLWPYIALTLLCGVRAEEARALRWEDVDLGEGIVWVKVSERFQSRTKTIQSKRRLRLADVGVEALKEQQLHQARQRVAAGELWTEQDRIFTTALGIGLNNEQVRIPFKRLMKRAGLGDDWVPRETRKTFASLLKDNSVTADEIAAALGHADTRTTKKYYIEDEIPVLVDVSAPMMEMLSKARLPGRLSDIA